MVRCFVVVFLFSFYFIIIMCVRVVGVFGGRGVVGVLGFFGLFVCICEREKCCI